MTVYVNDKPRDFEDGKSISEIIPELNLKDLRGVAIAVNYQVINKDKWDQYPLKNKDKLTIIKATAGG